MRNVLVSFAELSDLLKNTTSAEECAGRIEGLKAFKDGTAKEEANVKAAKEAQFKTECAISNAFNKPVVENYDIVFNAIELGIENFKKVQAKKQYDAYDSNKEQDNAIPEDVVKDPKRCWIKEKPDGDYLVNYLGQDYELKGLEPKNISETTRMIRRG